MGQLSGEEPPKITLRPVSNAQSGAMGSTTASNWNSATRAAKRRVAARAACLRDSEWLEVGLSSPQPYVEDVIVTSTNSGLATLLYSVVGAYLCPRVILSSVHGSMRAAASLAQIRTLLPRYWFDTLLVMVAPSLVVVTPCGGDAVIVGKITRFTCLAVSFSFTPAPASKDNGLKREGKFAV